MQGRLEPCRPRIGLEAVSGCRISPRSGRNMRLALVKSEELSPRVFPCACQHWSLLPVSPFQLCWPHSEQS